MILFGDKTKRVKSWKVDFPFEDNRGKSNNRRRHWKRGVSLTRKDPITRPRILKRLRRLTNSTSKKIHLGALFLYVNQVQHVPVQIQKVPLCVCVIQFIFASKFEPKAAIFECNQLVKDWLQVCAHNFLDYRSGGSKQGVQKQNLARESTFDAWPVTT